MKQSRGLYIWLTLIGVVIGVVAITGAVSPLIGAIGVGGYFALLASVFAANRLQRLQTVIPTFTAATRSTPAARLATSRARKLSSQVPDEAVVDIGIIVNE